MVAKADMAFSLLKKGGEKQGTQYHAIKYCVIFLKQISILLNLSNM